MSVKLKASELGLADLRYDVEVPGYQWAHDPKPARWVGTLLGIKGPFIDPYGENVVHVMFQNGAEPIRVVVEADSEVTVDRTSKRAPVHFGGA